MFIKRKPTGSWGFVLALFGALLIPIVLSLTSTDWFQILSLMLSFVLFITFIYWARRW